MKWARIAHVKSDGTQITPKLVIPKRKTLSKEEQTRLAKYVKKIEVKELTVDSLHHKGFKEWLIQKKKLPQNFDIYDKADYEAFVGGFLYYYEKYSGINNQERTLLVDWGEINEKAAMTLYLKPLYTDFYDKNQKEIGTKQRGKGGSSPSKSKLSPLASPPSDQTDPPRPPYPPPPPRGFSNPT